MTRYYQYKLIDASGQHQSGRISAPDFTSARHIIGQAPYTVLEIKRQHRFNPIRYLQSRVSMPELIHFMQLLIWLLRAQTPMIKALEHIKATMKNTALSKALTMVIQDIYNGVTTTQAFQNQTNLYQNLGRYLSAHQASEQLVSNFESILYWQQKMQQFKKNLYKNLTYPIMLLFICSALLIFLNIFLIPQLEIFLVHMHLPLTGLNTLTTIISILTYGLATVAGLSIIGWICAQFTASHYILSQLVLRVPIVRTYFVYKNYYLYFSLLKLNLQGTQHPTVIIFDQCQDTFKSTVFGSIIAQLSTHIHQGQSLQAAFKSLPLLPHDIVMIIETAALSGSFAQGLDIVCGYFEEKLCHLCDTIIQFIGPVLLMLIGGLFITIISGVFIPIYQSLNQW